MRTRAVAVLRRPTAVVNSAEGILKLVATLTAFLPSFILAQAKATINWQKWEQASFNKAIQQNKMIFVDVGTEWCTACNWMEEDTYTDAKVIKLLNQNFVCIKVDAD